MKNKLFMGLSGIMLFAACSQETEQLTTDEVNHIVISAHDFKKESGSRTNLEISSAGAVFSWAEKDTVGIFPSDGAQVYFPMEKGAGTKTANFTGGGWALKNGFTYAAYYPFIGSYYLDKEKLPIDYTEQQQTGNASTLHLGHYDYMAAPPAIPSEGYVNFQFNHLGCLTQLRLTVPDIATFTTLSLSCEEAIFTSKAELGFTGINYSFTTKEYTCQIDLLLSDIESTEANQTLYFYVMLAPMNMTGKDVYATLLSEEGKMYKGVMESKNMQSGYSYDFPVVLEEVKDNLSAGGVKVPNLGETEEEI